MSIFDVQHQPRAHRVLQRAIGCGRMPHAYIFHGPDGVGKDMLAGRLARLLLCPNRREVEPPSGLASEGDAITYHDACGACEDCTLTVAGTHPDIKLRWKALFHLGKLDDKRFDYVNALDKLARVYEQNENIEIQGFAREEIEKIIDEKLSEENLLSLAGKYQIRFPADLLFLKLISIYRSQGDNVKFKSVSNDFSRRKLS